MFRLLFAWEGETRFGNVTISGFLLVSLYQFASQACLVIWPTAVNSSWLVKMSGKLSWNLKPGNQGKRAGMYPLFLACCTWGNATWHALVSRVGFAAVIHDVPLDNEAAIVFLESALECGLDLVLVPVFLSTFQKICVLYLVVRERQSEGEDASCKPTPAIYPCMFIEVSLIPATLVQVSGV